MALVIYPFLSLATVGFVVVLLAHLAALGGTTSAFERLAKFIFPGIFIVWLPTVLVMGRLTREFKQKDIWRAALRGCPRWMQRTLWVVIGYAFFVGFVLPIFYGGGMNSPANSARAMTAIALTFYAIAACVLYSATQVQKFDQNRRCVNGHRVSPLAKFCEECGAPIAASNTPSGDTHQ